MNFRMNAQIFVKLQCLETSRNIRVDGVSRRNFGAGEGETKTSIHVFVRPIARLWPNIFLSSFCHNFFACVVLLIGALFAVAIRGCSWELAGAQSSLIET